MHNPSLSSRLNYSQSNNSKIPITYYTYFIYYKSMSIGNVLFSPVFTTTKPITLVAVQLTFTIDSTKYPTLSTTIYKTCPRKILQINIYMIFRDNNNQFETWEPLDKEGSHVSSFPSYVYLLLINKIKVNKKNCYSSWRIRTLQKWVSTHYDIQI